MFHSCLRWSTGGVSVPDGLSRWIATLPSWLSGSVAAAVGSEDRHDPVLARTGGPAGNARLTAWTGAVLLVLFAAEGLTLLNLRSLITWHVVLGALLIPPTVLKIASTGWRMVSYYRAAAPYRTAGPPPTILRFLGPVVVASTAALLTTGVLLILLGQDRSRTTLASAGPLRIDWIWLHQASFAVWLVTMTVHVLGRVLPGMRILRQAVARPRAVPGSTMRVVALLAAGVLGAVCAFGLVAADSSWMGGHFFHHDHERR